MIRTMFHRPVAWVGTALLLFGIALAVTWNPEAYRTRDPYGAPDAAAAARIMVENERVVWTLGAFGFGLLMLGGAIRPARFRSEPS